MQPRPLGVWFDGFSVVCASRSTLSATMSWTSMTAIMARAVNCHNELERPESGSRLRGKLQYWDE